MPTQQFLDIKDNLIELPEKEFREYIGSIVAFAEINDVQKFIHYLADCNKAISSERIRIVQSKFWELID